MSADFGSDIELLAISEVAKLLTISVSAVRRLQQARQLAFMKVGGSVRFLKSDVVNYLKSRRVEAAD